MFCAIVQLIVKITIFQDVTQCTLVGGNNVSEEPTRSIKRLLNNHDDGGKKFIWNVSVNIYQSIQCLTLEDSNLHTNIPNCTTQYR